jgi:hypothetical protein
MPPQAPQAPQEEGKEIVEKTSFLPPLCVCGACGGHWQIGQ